MAVVWSTVQDHRGRIEVDSEPNKGCLISVYLPVMSGLCLLEPEKESIPMGQGQHILVVDDLPEQREIAGLVLERLGYRVSTAASGEEALQRLFLLAPDLVLLDMIMGSGHLDGLDCFQRMRTLMPELKVLLVTGFSEGERIQEAMALGALGHIKKPYTLDLLSRSVHYALRHSEDKE
jgi:CheY-like chemotaxis protein